MTAGVLRRLSPLQRLEALCDPGTLQLLTDAGSELSVVAASGRVGGRPVVCYAQDSSVCGGSVGVAEADVMVRLLRRARTSGSPLVAFLESAGARIQEGAAALGGFGRVFYENVLLSERVPQISVVTGTAAGGGCYSPALTDFVVMTEGASMFLTGPGVVHEALGERVTAHDLGGAGVHQRNGVCHLVAPGDEAAAGLARTLVSLLLGQRTVGWVPAAGPGPADVVPANPRKVYDVREVARRILDEDTLLEVSPRWARNLLTAFGRLEGRPVGVLANQPLRLGGVLDVDAAQKGARFIRICDVHGIPLVVLVDTPGFMPGSRQESAGVIRHGAQLVRAFAAATVPRCTVILRQAFGGAFITMNCKDIGADVVLAWPGSRIGIMSAESAVRVIHRRALVGAADEEVARLADDYARRHLPAAVAADLGLVDRIIAPQHTRAELVAALEPRTGSEAAGAQYGSPAVALSRLDPAP